MKKKLLAIIIGAALIGVVLASTVSGADMSMVSGYQEIVKNTDFNIWSSMINLDTNNPVDSAECKLTINVLPSTEPIQVGLPMSHDTNGFYFRTIGGGLASTGMYSGFVECDDTNGWGRINFSFVVVDSNTNQLAFDMNTEIWNNFHYNVFDDDLQVFTCPERITCDANNVENPSLTMLYFKGTGDTVALEINYDFDSVRGFLVDDKNKEIINVDVGNPFISSEGVLYGSFITPATSSSNFRFFIELTDDSENIVVRGMTTYTIPITAWKTPTGGSSQAINESIEIERVASKEPILESILYSAQVKQGSGFIELFRDDASPVIPKTEGIVLIITANFTEEVESENIVAKVYTPSMNELEVSLAPEGSLSGTKYVGFFYVEETGTHIVKVFHEGFEQGSSRFVVDESSYAAVEKWLFENWWIVVIAAAIIAGAILYLRTQ